MAMLGHLLLACSLLRGAPPAPREDSAAIVAILRLAFPGSRVVFGSSRDTLVSSSGRRDEVQLRFDRQDETHVGALIITFRARRDSAIARAERGVANPGRVPSELLVVDLSAKDVATALRRATLDAEAVGTTLNDMRISLDAGIGASASPGDTNTIPVVAAEYNATYVGRGWVGGVSWRALIEIRRTRIGAQQRYPEAFAKQPPGDSVRAVGGELQMTEPVPAETSITLQAVIIHGTSVVRKTITLPWSDTRPLSGVTLLSKL